MPRETLYYHVTKVDADSKRAWFLAKHKTEFPANDLAEFGNTADTERIIKVCANPQAAPPGITPIGVYNKAQVDVVLQSVGWAITPAGEG